MVHLELEVRLSLVMREIGHSPPEHHLLVGVVGLEIPRYKKSYLGKIGEITTDTYTLGKRVEDLHKGDLNT